MATAQEIKARMQASGVPERVFNQTLPALGHQDLRDAIKNEAFVSEDDDERYVGFSLYASSAKEYRSGKTAFFTLAKECVLSGYSVTVLSLEDLLDEEQNYKALENDVFDLLFIHDFYEQADTPMDGRAALRIRYILRQLMESGVGICTYTSVKLQDCGWYPPSFLKELEDINITKAV